MPANVSLSFRVDEQTVRQLDRLAEATDREDIRQALAEADDGGFATDEEMAETFASFDHRPGQR
ncbi:hypothetical protein [Skermanella pratensis]|uniref:hypothetical protein n=1 Tax=Skermanella pratensis TaxID=2233999 RepID=UPI001301212A|nr:hypothetical protein [Skermanella pratensis]